MKKKYLTRREAALYVTGQGLNLALGTLQKMATVGGGPRYAIFGKRAVYTRPDLDAWIAERLGMAAATTNEHASLA